MLSGRAFRAQLVTQGQRTLYDHWVQLAGSRCLPARSDLDPFKLAKLLPDVSLIDVSHGVGDAWFRLAGTRLHDIYDEEITGKRISDVFTGASADYWRRVHGRVVNNLIPLAGVVRGPAEGRDHVVLFWLRLPLSEDGNRADRILCHDTAGPTESAAESRGRIIAYPAIYPEARPSSRRVQYA